VDKSNKKRGLALCIPVNTGEVGLVSALAPRHAATVSNNESVNAKEASPVKVFALENRLNLNLVKWVIAVYSIGPVGLLAVHETTNNFDSVGEATNAHETGKNVLNRARTESTNSVKLAFNNNSRRCLLVILLLVFNNSTDLGNKLELSIKIL